MRRKQTPADPRRRRFAQLRRGLRPRVELPETYIPEAPQYVPGEVERVPEGTCPPFRYPDPTDIRVPTTDKAPPVTPEQDDFIGNLAERIAKKNGEIQWNPYVFPTPWSQDFDQLGNVLLENTAERSRVVRFQIPKGYVGVWTHFGMEIPASIQDLVTVFPTIDDKTMKTIDEQTHITHPAISSTTIPGVRYPMGTLMDPRKTFHALQSEMYCGMSVTAAAAANPQLPTRIRAVVRGRYWPVGVASRFWSYLKSD